MVVVQDKLKGGIMSLIGKGNEDTLYSLFSGVEKYLNI